MTTAKAKGRKPVEYPKQPEKDPGETAPVTEPEATITTVVETNGHAMQPKPLDPNAGTYALAMLSDEEFSERLDLLKRGRQRIATIQTELMEPGVDYGLIPGTPKPTLFKSGAEKLAQIYGLAARLETTFTPGDGETQPLLKYEAACFLHLGSFDGIVIAVGHGTANGWEKRYRREADKACPDCGKTAIIASKYEPGWYCFPKRGGCGHKFPPGDERLTTQSTDSRGDPVAANDLQNTLLKMAEKRAFVDAVLRATASSSLFTQDVAEEKDERTEADQGGYDNHIEPTKQEATNANVTAGGAVVNEDGEVVERKESNEPEPEVRTTTVKGVGRGGHREEATQEQVDEVKRTSKAMKLGPHRLADEISSAVGGGIDSTELPEDPREAANKVLEFLTGMASVDIGRVITHLKSLQAHEA